MGICVVFKFLIRVQCCYDHMYMSSGYMCNSFARVYLVVELLDYRESMNIQLQDTRINYFLKLLYKFTLLTIMCTRFCWSIFFCQPLVLYSDFDLNCPDQWQCSISFFLFEMGVSLYSPGRPQALNPPIGFSLPSADITGRKHWTWHCTSFYTLIGHRFSLLWNVFMFFVFFLFGCLSFSYL
jgi:hypothetical protein